MSSVRPSAQANAQERAAQAHTAHPTGTSSSTVAEQGTGELIKQATQQLPDLVRAELRLAVAEIKDKGTHAGKGVGLFGGAGLVALYGAAPWSRR
nr:phage holin family protein [Actinomadura rudentiformis]